MQKNVLHLKHQDKTYSFFLPSSLIPILLLGIFSYFSVVKSLEEEYDNSSVVSLGKVAADIAITYQQINDYAEALSRDEAIISILDDKLSTLSLSNSNMKRNGYDFSYLHKYLNDNNGIFKIGNRKDSQIVTFTKISTNNWIILAITNENGIYKSVKGISWMTFLLIFILIPLPVPYHPASILPERSIFISCAI